MKLDNSKIHLKGKVWKKKKQKKKKKPFQAWGSNLCPKVIHYENLSLKMTLKNHSYSENQYFKRKCCTENFSVLFKCNFQRCFCLT